MRPARSRTALLSLACLACAGLAQEPTTAAKRLADGLAKEKKAFAKIQEKAKKEFLTALTSAEAVAVQADPSPLGQAKQKSLRAERTVFDKSGTLPASDEALPGLFAYLTAVQAARPKVRQAHDKLIKQLGKDGDEAGMKKARADLDAFDASVQGVEGFTNGSRWMGVLQKPRGSTNITFTVREVTPVLVKGLMSLDNNWCQMEVEGLRDGPRFDLRVTKVVIGGNDMLVATFAGFACGDRLVIEANNLLTKKRVAIAGVATLSRAGK